jgi:hypothetical protein
LDTLAGKNRKKLDIWKGAMSIAGRTTLINSSLTSTFIYHMSMYLLPKTIVNELDKQRRKFFWQGGGLLTVYFGAPSMFITLWFGFDYGTNPPLGTLII